jgi:hypothetical protein
MHSLPQRTGAALMGALAGAADAVGAMLVTEALVRELWVDDDRRVIGVGFQRPDGKREHLACGALLLACNGFGGNAAMVDELLPEMRDAVFAGHAGNDGSAIAWGRALGARLADLGGYQGHGSWAVPQGALITWALMTEGGVQVNARGERFHDETEGYSEASVKVLAQPGGRAWNLFDDRLLALGRSFPDFVDAEAAGAVRTAPDVAALAALIGCDAATLARTLAGTRLAAPWHAVQVTGALFHTQGGLDIDARCRVHDGHGTPLQNVLAAGGAARGVSGATRSGATSPATGCLAPSPEASSPPARRRRSWHGVEGPADRTPALARSRRLRRLDRADRRADRLRDPVPLGRVDRCTRLARSEVGLTTATEVEDTLARITDRVALPVIVALAEPDVRRVTGSGRQRMAEQHDAARRDLGPGFGGGRQLGRDQQGRRNAPKRRRR